MRHSLRCTEGTVTEQAIPPGLLARFGELRQPVAQPNPREPGARARVVLGRDPFWHIEAAGGDVELVGVLEVLESKLRAAVGAERALAFRARRISRRCALNDPEFRPP